MVLLPKLPAWALRGMLKPRQRGVTLVIGLDINVLVLIRCEMMPSKLEKPPS